MGTGWSDKRGCVVTTSEYGAYRKSHWTTLVLLVIAAMCLPLVIGESHWFPEAKRLIAPALFGLAVGILLAKTPFPAWMSWAVGIMLGIDTALQLVGRLLPPVLVIIGDVGRAIGWLWHLVIDRTLATPLPFTRSVTHLAAQGQKMLLDLGSWLYAVQLGQTTEDITALMLGVTFVVWCLCWYAGYELFQGKRTFVALLPLGVGVLANVGFTDYGMPYVQVYLAVTLLVLVSANAERIQEVWSRLGLDFSDELRQDALRAGGLITAGIVVIALLMPYVTYNRTVWAFWERYGSKFQTFYDNLDKAFAGRNPVPEPTPGGPGLAPHTLTSGGTLGQDVVLLVRTSDPEPLPEEELRMVGMDEDETVPQRYWRERTYDVYSGHGWNSTEGQIDDYVAGNHWKQVAFPSTVLTQTFDIAGPGLSYGFAVNEPVLVEQDYRVLTRSEGDFAAFAVGESDYTVVSLLPAPTEDELLVAEAPYPEEIAGAYLQLPRGLPARVRRKAEQIVEEAGAETRYEKARALERYIRDFDYDLAVEPPPLDADVVDYFLFTTQKGYCDYSATTMAVMLRAVGVAARYASGYAMGEYDYGRQAWVVRERQAHAWTEVYFPGYGWIEFEPTPTQRIFVRPVQISDSLAADSGTQPKPQVPRQVPLWLYGLALLLAVIFAVVWPPRWFRKREQDPRTLIRGIYDILLRRARWAGVAPHQGQTSVEYLVGLGRWLEGNTDWDTSRDMTLLARSYQKARYSQEEISHVEGHGVQDAWRRIRGRFVQLIFMRLPREQS